MFTVRLATNRLVGLRFHRIASRSKLTQAQLLIKFKTSRFGLFRYKTGLKSLPGELIPVLLELDGADSEDEFFFCSLNLKIVNEYIDKHIFLKVLKKIETSFN
ncbi:MAG: hypothetical protein ACRBBP_10345 [Bdellovibrionales bacterium]